MEDLEDLVYLLLKNSPNHERPTIVIKERLTELNQWLVSNGDIEVYKPIIDKVLNFNDILSKGVECEVMDSFTEMLEFIPMYRSKLAHNQ